MDSLIDHSINDDIFNDYENSYDNRGKQSYNSQESFKEFNELNNNESRKSNKNIENECDNNISYFREKSNLIQNVYGGMNHA